MKPHFRIVGEEPEPEASFDDAPLLPETLLTVEAQCIRKRPLAYFPEWRQHKFRLDFRIIEPWEFQGLILWTWVHYEPKKWKKISVRSKLWKMARIANPGVKLTRRNVTADLFVNKIFVCLLGTTIDEETGVRLYSTVSKLVKKLSG